MWWAFFAAIVASSTALYIAMVVYPSQKEVDRKFELRRERRKEYRRFFDLTSSVRLSFERFSFQDGAEPFEAFEELLRARESFEVALLGLSLLGEKEVVDEAMTGHGLVSEMIDEAERTLEQIKLEVSRHVPAKEVARRIRAGFRPYRSRYLSFQTGLVKTMRSSEIDDDLELSVDVPGGKPLG